MAAEPYNEHGPNMPLIIFVLVKRTSFSTYESRLCDPKKYPVHKFPGHRQETAVVIISGRFGPPPAAGARVRRARAKVEIALHSNISHWRKSRMNGFAPSLSLVGKRRSWVDSNDLPGYRHQSTTYHATSDRGRRSAHIDHFVPASKANHQCLTSLKGMKVLPRFGGGDPEFLS
ncbi:hypothetical protein EVAR_66718_1 [Eumeta japonica]|uniref:Uncharacterized protein n=1 Tax=Eumeta variegata TaxID=151549 RepID=A0A4C2A390_EUMVA|nr:hypothetical protein EVAR_66718_1 [Eumeta japonica]